MDTMAYLRYQGNVDGMLIMLHLAALGITPSTGGPIGFTKSGRPIYAIQGADDAGLEQKMDDLTTAIRDLGTRMQDSAASGRAPDGGRYAAAADGAKATADMMAELE